MIYYGTRAEDGHFIYIYPSFHQVTLCVEDNKEIVKLKIELAKNQELPETREEEIAIDYWGWYDFKNEEISLIQSSWILMKVCFGNSMNTLMQNGMGKPVRLNIEVAK